jgi:Zn-dependent protease with chaperone function
MTRFDAHFFDGRTSRALPVTVDFDGVTLAFGSEMDGTAVRASIIDCSVDPAVGRTKRSIRLPGGALLQTYDHNAVRTMERSLGVNRSSGLVHFLESRWKMVAVCMVCLALALFALVYYAIPHASMRVARIIPPEVTASASKNTLKIFDARFLGPSGLTAERQDEIRGLFDDVARSIVPGGATGYRLEFRTGKKIGANAFALPSGIIIVTDELISLSESDDELAGIFAHEIAHVKNRHALRSILQSTGVFFLITLLSGDVTSITSFAAFLPTLLVESGYSREFEREADHAAASFLIAGGKGTVPFRKILEKLDASQPGALKLGVFSDHPETAKRIEHLKELQRAAGGGSR